jgi:acyl-coenzyme A thioesterase PaaI-like protein
MPFSGLQNGSGPISHGAYTVVAADAAAGSVALNTILTNIETYLVQAVRAGVAVTEDAIVSVSGGTLTVASGAVTYVLTAGDVLEWLAIGT